MKILHICLGCFFIDGFSYQENMLPKFHKKAGFDVEIIASTLSFDEFGEACYVKPNCYVNEYGIQVTRLPYSSKLPTKLSSFLRVYDGFYQCLKNSRPDIIFVHGCQFLSIKVLKEYIKENPVLLYIDNHADFSNSARNFLSRYILHGLLWKYCANLMLPYTEKYYGVLPARVDFLNKIYKIPANKIELLMMGVDDDLVKNSVNEDNRRKIRQSLGISKNDFLIITGGKIDHAKEQVLLLEQAVKEIGTVKLVIFGSVVEDMKEKFFSYIDNKNIFYVGWLDSNKTANYIGASDLAIYPGRHSTLWEETVGLGIPMIVKYWEGTTHVNINNNIKFLMNDSLEEIESNILSLTQNEQLYNIMKNNALQAMKEFSYANIAKQSICNN